MKTFCPSCEKETSCVYIAELYECKECGCDFESKQRQMQERLDAANARAEAAEARAERLQAAVMMILVCVDYTSGARGLTEMIGGVLPRQIIDRARDALKGGEE